MTVGEVQKAQELVGALADSLTEQQAALIHLRKSLEEYTDWLRDEIIKIRDGGSNV